MQNTNTWGAIDNVEVTTNNRLYFVPGTYTVEVVALKSGISKRSTSAMPIPYFAAELKIIESSTPERKPGQIVSWVVMVTPKYPDAAYRDIKRFIAAVAGADPSEVDGAAVDLATSADNPFAGSRVVGTVTEKAGKADPNKTFTILNWSAT
jgi:hypothetical protein